jgi:hypothetical protein
MSCFDPLDPEEFRTVTMGQREVGCEPTAVTSLPISHRDIADRTDRVPVSSSGQSEFSMDRPAVRRRRTSHGDDGLTSALDVRHHVESYQQSSANHSRQAVDLVGWEQQNGRQPLLGVIG